MMSHSEVSQSNPVDFSTLAPREAACLRLAATLSAKEVALQLGLSYRSVQQYQHSACKKLGISGTRRAAWLLHEHERIQRVEQVQGELGELASRPDRMPIEPTVPLPRSVPANPAADMLHDSVALIGTRNDPFGPLAEDRAAGRLVQLGGRDRMLLVLAWALSAPVVLALIVTAYLGMTMIEKGLFQPS